MLVFIIADQCFLHILVSPSPTLHEAYRSIHDLTLVITAELVGLSQMFIVLFNLLDCDFLDVAKGTFGQSIGFHSRWFRLLSAFLRTRNLHVHRGFALEEVLDKSFIGEQLLHLAFDELNTNFKSLQLLVKSKYSLILFLPQ